MLELEPQRSGEEAPFIVTTKHVEQLRDVLPLPKQPTPKMPQHIQEKVEQLKTLCKNYMDYALNALGKGQPEHYPKRIHSNKQNMSKSLLEQKYNFVVNLYRTIEREPKDVEAALRQFATKLNEPKHVILMNTHRDSIFIRLISAISEIIKSIHNCIASFFTCPSAQTNRSSFFQPPKSERLREALYSIANEALQQCSTTNNYSHAL